VPVGGLVEIVREGETGWMADVRTADALARVMRAAAEDGTGFSAPFVTPRLPAVEDVEEALTRLARSLHASCISWGPVAEIGGSGEIEGRAVRAVREEGDGPEAEGTAEAQTDVGPHDAHVGGQPAERGFVEAVRSLGAGPTRILFRHIVPHLMPTIIVWGTLGIATTVLLEATLSYLGIGVQPPTPSWGNIIFENQTYFQAAPWLVFFPGAAILLLALAFNLVGDALRDVLDPLQRGRG
jgi:hypothetical protein